MSSGWTILAAITLAAQDREQRADVLVIEELPLAVCDAGALADPDSPCARVAREQDVRDTIGARARAFSAAYEAGNVEAMIDIYTADGVAMPGARQPIRGRIALRDYWRLPEGVSVLSHETTSEQVELVADDVAIDRGLYRGQTRRADGSTNDFSGRYLIVWVDRGGEWRMAYDMWASD